MGDDMCSILIQFTGAKVLLTPFLYTLICTYPDANPRAHAGNEVEVAVRCLQTLRLPPPLLDLDTHLPEMPLPPLILVRLLSLLKRKDLRIDHGLQPIRLDGPVHLLKLQPGPHDQPAHRTHGCQRIDHGRRVLALAAQKADDGDQPVHAHRLQALRHGDVPADLDDVVHALAVGRELARRLAPGLVGLVVDDMRGAQVGEPLGLVVRGRRGDDARAGRDRELQRKHADAA